MKIKTIIILIGTLHLSYIFCKYVYMSIFHPLVVIDFIITTLLFFLLYKLASRNKKSKLVYEEFTINEKKHKLPANCVDTITEIKYSTYILDLDDDFDKWNDEGFVPVNNNVYDTSIEFLVSYTNKLAQKRIFIKSPQLALCPNGSIDLSWRTDNARMLINIREENNEIIAFYYGDINKNEDVIKGHVKTGEVSKHLVSWMEKLI